MPSSVTQATLDYLARRLEGLADQFPSRPEAVDAVALTDDISMLAHHLQHALERAQDRFTTPETVHPPERFTLVQFATAAAGIAHALNTLTEALTYATTGFQLESVEDLAHSRLRNDPEALQIMAAEKYVAARFRLRDTAAALRETSAPAGPSTPRPTGLRTQPAAAPQPRQPNRR